MLVAGAPAVRWSAGALTVLVLLAGAGTALVSYEAADRLVHPPREVPAWTPADLGLAFEQASFTATDAVRLSGWWIPAAGVTPLGTVVFLHGYGASRGQVQAVVGFLHDAGYDVLAFDFRGHGTSGGAYTTIGIEEARDVTAAVAYAQARSPLPVVLFGWSMGAAAALNAADELPGVRAIVVDSAFARLANVVSNNLAAFTGLPRYPFEPLILHFASRIAGHEAGENEPARRVGALQRPILIIHGLEDRIAQAEGDGRAIADSAGGWAQLWLVPGAGHVDAHAAQPVEYETRVLRFLQEALA